MSPLHNLHNSPHKAYTTPPANNTPQNNQYTPPKHKPSTLTHTSHIHPPSSSTQTHTSHRQMAANTAYNLHHIPSTAQYHPHKPPGCTPVCFHTCSQSKHNPPGIPCTRLQYTEHKLCRYPYNSHKHHQLPHSR
jgi:hypothetical protein